MKFDYPTVEEITGDLAGFYRISHEAYHRGLGVSSTAIKKALVSYATYTQRDHVDSAALAFGRAFHAALVEPGLYAEQYVAMPEFAGIGSQALRGEWLEANTGRFVVSRNDQWSINHMVASVKDHEEYGKYGDFQAEIMAIAQCPDTAFQIKCKADFFGSAIVDFKTTSSGLSPGEVLRDMVKWRYHVSAAFYQDIVALLTGERLPFITVPVAKKPPYECEFYQLSDEILAEGRKLYKAGLRRIAAWAKPTYRSASDKRLRTLYPNSRLLYDAQELLDFIEA